MGVVGINLVRDLLAVRDRTRTIIEKASRQP
jgi:hypothetical protein